MCCNAGLYVSSHDWKPSTALELQNVVPKIILLVVYLLYSNLDGPTTAQGPHRAFRHRPLGPDNVLDCTPLRDIVTLTVHVIL